MFRTIALEIRDEGTFIPVIATKAHSNDEAEQWLLRRAGFGEDAWQVFVTRLIDADTQHDAFNWGCSRTMKQAHLYIQKHFDELEPGDVIDVSYILGETNEKKVSERWNSKY